ncbi:hypothetical protein COOONC_01416 [Cooperia oncophora]
MTTAERKKEADFRLICRDRNKEQMKRTWVVYGELRRIDEVSQPRALGNVVNHVDRSKRRGGGVRCLAKNSVNFISIDVPQNLKVDVVVVEGIDDFDISSSRVILVYRPPGSVSTEGEKLMDAILNLGLTGSRPNAVGGNNTTSTKFVDLFKCCGLTQHVLKPTRGTSILDIVLTSAPMLNQISILPPFASSETGGSFSMVTSQLKIFIKDSGMRSQKTRLFGNLTDGVPNQQYRNICGKLDYHPKRFLANSERRAKINPCCELPVLHDDSGNRYAEDDQKAEALGGFFASVFVRNSDTSCPNLERKTSLGLDDFVIHPSEVTVKITKKVENSYSSLCDCLSGVPQGGVLSPLLFLAYTHDLPSLLRTHSSVRVQPYAEDIKVCGFYKEEDRVVIQEAMSRSISNMM